MQIKPIRSEADYQDALKRIAPLFEDEPEFNTPEGAYFDAMCLLIEEWEKTHYRIDSPF